MKYEMLSHVLFAALVSTPPIFIAALIVKYRRRKNRVVGQQEVMIEDPQALAAAQLEADSLNVRKTLSRDNVILDNYSSMQGYTMNYMDQLVAFLEKNQIPAHYYFQEAMPTGVITVTGATGTYELYVPRGSEVPARAAIKRFRDA